MLTWYSLAIAFCLALAVAFVLAWRIEDESKAYSRAFCIGLALVFMPAIGDVLLASSFKQRRNDVLEMVHQRLVEH